jgi:hypothetical protein
MNTPEPSGPDDASLEQILKDAHDDLLQHVRSSADPAQAMAAIMDRFHVLDDTPAEPRRLTVSPAQAAQAIEMRLALHEAQGRFARARTHNLATLEGIDHVLTRPGWREMGARYLSDGGRPVRSPAVSGPAVLAGLQSLADQVFFDARPDESDFKVFTEEQREYLADDLVRAILPGTAHDLEVEEIHLESALARLIDATEIYGRRVNFSDLRRTRGAVKDLGDVIDAITGIIDTLAGALGMTVIDASGVDLSALGLSDVDILDGVRWTRGAAHVGDTIWSPGLTIQVLENSAEIAPGTYQVRLGTQEAPIELART